MHVLKLFKNQRGNTLINVAIGASLLAGGAILVSQGIVSQRKNSVRLNQAGTAQSAAKNIIDAAKTTDNNRTELGNVNYYPVSYTLRAGDDATATFSELNPRNGFTFEEYTYAPGATAGTLSEQVQVPATVPGDNSETSADYVIRGTIADGADGSMGARYFFTPVRRADTTGIAGLAGWAITAPMGNTGLTDVAFNLADVNAADGGPDDGFKVTTGLHATLAGGGAACNGNTANMTSQCEDEYNEDAAVVIANSINTWQSLNSAISRLAYYYNSEAAFCNNTNGVDIVIDSAYDWSWINNANTDVPSAQAYWRQLIPTNLWSNIPNAQNVTVSVKLELEDLLDPDKATSCNDQGNFQPIPPGSQANSGALTSDGLRMTILLAYEEVDANGSVVNRFATYTNSFSQNRLPTELRFVGNLGMRVYEYAGGNAYQPANGMQPVPGGPICGEIRGGDNATISSPTIEFAATYEGSAAVPFCRLEYMKPQAGNSIRATDIIQGTGPAIQPSIDKAFAYKDSGWFLCTMPPSGFAAGVDPDRLNVMSPLVDPPSGTHPIGKDDIVALMAADEFSIHQFENISITQNNQSQSIALRVKGLTEGHYTFSMRAVDASRTVSDIVSTEFSIDLMRPFAITVPLEVYQQTATGPQMTDGAGVAVSNDRYVVGRFGDDMLGTYDWKSNLPNGGASPNEQLLEQELIDTFTYMDRNNPDPNQVQLFQCGGGTPAFKPPDQNEFGQLYTATDGGVKWYFGPSRPDTGKPVYKVGGAFDANSLEAYFENNALPTGAADASGTYWDSANGLERLYFNCDPNATPEAVIGPRIPSDPSNSGEYMVAMQMCDLCGQAPPSLLSFRYWIADFPPVAPLGVNEDPNFTVEVNGGATAIGSNSFNMRPSQVAPVFEYQIDVNRDTHKVGRYNGSRQMPFVAVCEQASADAPFDNALAIDKSNFTYTFDRFHTNYVQNGVDIYGNPVWEIQTKPATHQFMCEQDFLGNACQQDTSAPVTGVIAGAAIDPCGRFRPHDPPSDAASVASSTEVNTYMVRGYSDQSATPVRNDRCKQVDCAPGYYCDANAAAVPGSGADATGVCRAQSEIRWATGNSFGGTTTNGGRGRGWGDSVTAVAAFPNPPTGQNMPGNLGDAPPQSPGCWINGAYHVGAECRCGQDNDCNNNITGTGSCVSPRLQCNNDYTALCSASETNAGACLILATIGGTQVTETNIGNIQIYRDANTTYNNSPLQSGSTVHPAACVPAEGLRGYLDFDTNTYAASSPIPSLATGGANPNETLAIGQNCNWQDTAIGDACSWTETRRNQHTRHETNFNEWCTSGGAGYGDWQWISASSTDHATCVNRWDLAHYNPGLGNGPNDQCATRVLDIASGNRSACRDANNTGIGGNDKQWNDYDTNWPMNAGEPSTQYCSTGNGGAPATGSVAWTYSGGTLNCTGTWQETSNGACSYLLEFEADTSCRGEYVGGGSVACGSSYSFNNTGSIFVSKALCELGASHPAHCNNPAKTCSGAGDVGSTCHTNLPTNCGSINSATQRTCQTGSTCGTDTCPGSSSPSGVSCDIGTSSCLFVNGGNEETFTCDDVNNCDNSGSYPTTGRLGESCSVYNSTNYYAFINGNTVRQYHCLCPDRGVEDCEGISSGYSDPTGVSCTQSPYGKTCQRTDGSTDYNYECQGCYYNLTNTHNYPSNLSGNQASSSLPSCSDTSACSIPAHAGALGNSQRQQYCWDSASQVVRYRVCEFQSCTVPGMECQYNGTAPDPWDDHTNMVSLNFGGQCHVDMGTCSNPPTNIASGTGTDNAQCPNLNPFGGDSCKTVADVQTEWCSGYSFAGVSDGCGSTLSGTGTAVIGNCPSTGNPPTVGCVNGNNNGYVCDDYPDFSQGGCNSRFNSGGTPSLKCEVKAYCDSDELFYKSLADCQAAHGTTAGNCTQIPNSTFTNLGGNYCGKGCPGGTDYSSMAACQADHGVLGATGRNCQETHSGSGIYCPIGCPSVGFAYDAQGYSTVADCEESGAYVCDRNADSTTNTSDRFIISNTRSSAASINTTNASSVSSTHYPVRTSTSASPYSMTGTAGIVASTQRYCRVSEPGPTKCTGADEEYEIDWSDCVINSGGDPTKCLSQVSNGTCADKSGCNGTIHVQDDMTCHPVTGGNVIVATGAITGCSQSIIDPQVNTCMFVHPANGNSVPFCNPGDLFYAQESPPQTTVQSACGPGCVGPECICRRAHVYECQAGTSPPVKGDAVNSACCNDATGVCYFMGDYTYTMDDMGVDETEYLFCDDTVTTSAPSKTWTSGACSDAPERYRPAGDTSSGNACGSSASTTLCDNQTTGGGSTTTSLDYEYFVSGDSCSPDTASSDGWRLCAGGNASSPGFSDIEVYCTPSGGKVWTTGECSDPPERARPKGSGTSGFACDSTATTTSCYRDTYAGGLPSQCTQTQDEDYVAYLSPGACDGNSTANAWGQCTEYDIINGGSACPPVDPHDYQEMEVFCTPPTTTTATPSTTCEEYWCRDTTSSPVAGNSPPSDFVFQVYRNGAANATIHANVTTPPIDPDGDTLVYTFHFSAFCTTDFISESQMLATSAGSTTTEWPAGTQVTTMNTCEAANFSVPRGGGSDFQWMCPSGEMKYFVLVSVYDGANTVWGKFNSLTGGRAGGYNETGPGGSAANQCSITSSYTWTDIGSGSCASTTTEPPCRNIENNSCTTLGATTTCRFRNTSCGGGQMMYRNLECQ